MKVGQITVENITFFESFLLPQAAMNFRSGTDGLFLGLMWKKTAVGALAGTIEQDTFVIDSFYVAPEYRRKGGATVLMDKLCDLLKKQVFVITADLVMTGDEQSGMDGFLSRYGFRQDFERMGKTYQTTLQHMKECKAFQGTYKGPDHSFAQCDKSVLSVEARHAAYMGAPCTEKSFLEQNVDQNVSQIHFKDNQMEKKYSMELKVSAPAVNKVTERMILEMLPECQRISRFYVLAL